jgi:hypothetical protein
MAADIRLAIMTFVQRWDKPSKTLRANVVLVPSAAPVGEPLVGGTPAFADRLPTFKAAAIGSLDVTPKTNDPLALRIDPTFIDPSTPVVPRPMFDALLAQAATLSVTIQPNGPLGVAPRSVIRKALPQSYLDASGARPDGNAATTDEFGCAIRSEVPEQVTGPPPKVIKWGALLSYALRQPTLATRLGLRYELSIPIADPAMYKDGGWLFLELAKGDAWAAAAQPGEIRLYASRIPALDDSRQVFAAVLFPVDASGTSADDQAVIEAETYDDGFAKIVHANQPTANDAVVGDRKGIPAATDAGIQIGWDDEQVVTWQNRQIDLLKARVGGTLDAQSPLGVSGYRVDVADVTGASGPPPPSAFHSLVTAEVTLPGKFGKFQGELAIEPTPLRPQKVDDEAWLPRYFAMWRGGSLLYPDPVPKALVDGQPIVPKSDPIGVLLSYGRTYTMRVRLADLSGGGPVVADDVINDGPAALATLDFRRHLPPKSPRIVTPPSPKIPEKLTFFRPLIGYPEVLFTQLGKADADRIDIGKFFTVNAKPGTGKVVGLPDPDVEKLVIAIEVRAPIHDAAGDGELDPPFRVVYRTERTLPALPAGPTPVDPGLALDIAYVDAPSIEAWAKTQPSTGPLLVPRARDVRITAHARLRDDPVAIAPEARDGIVAQTTLRAESRNEPPLLIAPVDGLAPIRGFMFRRPSDVAAPPVAAQLAQELRVAVEEFTFSAPPGHRIVFGASKALRHTLSGDNSAITIASVSELLREWVVALAVDLERDWTWDGLENDTIAVERDGVIVGSAQILGTVGPAATSDTKHWDRSRTRVIFFDAVDPHEATPTGFPQALEHTWRLIAKRVIETGPPVGVNGTPILVGPLPAPGLELEGKEQKLTLPITLPPAQVPKLASVGIALSPFQAGAGYATTGQRRRFLWLELEQPIANQEGDALFARVLAHGADPLLYNAVPDTRQPSEPSLILDPEIMRVIVPGDSDDRAGVDAMTWLEPASDSDRHFLLPLPPGIEPDDPELFGFYTYELRVGHLGEPHDTRWWSTAQGRFGRPLHVNGVQHPAPPLACRAGRVRLGANTLAEHPDAPEASFIPADALAAAAARLKRTDLGVTNIDALLAVSREATFVLATAPYATPVLGGRALVTPFQTPKTTLCFFLYAQVVQADAASNRNVLLMHRYGTFLPREPGNEPARLVQRDRVGRVIFTNGEIADALNALGLPDDLSLSVLAAELLPGGVGNDLPKPRTNPALVSSPPPSVTSATAAATEQPDPLGAGLDFRPQRILRVSPLVAVAPVC